MTMPQGSAEEPDVTFVQEFSVPPLVVSTARKGGAAEFGQWHSYLVANVQGPWSATPGAQRIANRNLRRKRLLIAIQPTIAAQPVLDGVIVGSREFITSGNAGVSPFVGGCMGGYLPIGTSLRWEVQQELWACYPVSNANPVLVTVCDEAYASSPFDDDEEGFR